MSRPSATYQQLEDVMKSRPGCPICAIGLKASRSYLDGLLWESVNDSGVREILKKSLGFCGYHSRELLTFSGQRVAVAMLQRAILQTAATELGRSPSPLRETLAQRLQDRLSSAKDKSSITESRATLETCPACIRQQQAETRAIQTLLEHFPGDFVGPLQHIGGLCWPHFQQSLLATTEAPIRARLIELHREIWADIISHLDEFIRKNDYRFHAENITESERMAVDRSIAILTGEYPAQPATQTER